MTGFERLRAIAGVWDEWGLGGTFAEIADQIERERDAEVADSPYDAILPEDRDAITWVREHGGLDEVRRRWKYLSYYADPVPRSCMEKRLARLQRQIDESHAALRRRNQRIAFLASEINREHNENRMEFLRRAGNFTAFADEVCKRLAPQLRHVEGCTKDVMDAALEALDRRLMPEGCEWPRYDSGELVLIGDDVIGPDYGESIHVDEITFHANGFTVREKTGLDHWYESDDRFERPSVLAADGEPLEVGQTVWHVDGRELTVTGLPKLGEYQGVAVKNGNGFITTFDPCLLTHQRPVLDADGVPIDEGDTVWNATTSAGPFTVREIERSDDPDEPEDIVWCGEHAANGFKVWRIAGQLTHTKPEVDTWQRIEEDARGLDSGVDRELCTHTHEDIVRRCRALAERERGE